MAFVFSESGLLRIATLLVTEDSGQADGPLFGCSIALYVTGPTPTPDMVIGDFTPTAITGMGPKTAVTWSAGYITQAGRSQVTSQSLTFIASAIPSAETIAGYIVYQEGTPDVLIGAEEFDEPVPITAVGDGVSFAVNVNMPGQDHGDVGFLP